MQRDSRRSVRGMEKKWAEGRGTAESPLLAMVGHSPLVLLPPHTNTHMCPTRT